VTVIVIVIALLSTPAISPARTHTHPLGKVKKKPHQHKGGREGPREGEAASKQAVKHETSSRFDRLPFPFG